MRTIKELLEVMLDNKQLFYEGLCMWKRNLWRHRIITDEEETLLKNYINRNRPSKFSSIDAFICRNKGIYWSFNQINPRIKWLKKHIKKNE